MDKHRGMKAYLIVFMILLMSFSARAFSQKAVSEEAKRHFDRGMAAVEMAKSPDDYAPAIKEFEQAKSLAPDWPNVYYNLGLVQEKAGKYSDAITNLKQYLRLAPNANNAETVKSLINKLEYKKDQEEGVKRVYEMMTSGNYEIYFPVGVCKHSGDEWILHGPWTGQGGAQILTVFRMASGEMQVKRVESAFDPESEFHPELHPPTRKWNPVKVNGRFYEYTHSSYMDVNLGYTVRSDYEVKGEIISIDPPRVKEITNISVPWGASIPFPGGQDAGRPPWSDNSHATTECVFEWKPKEGSINADNYGNTSLGWAIIRGHKEEVESLIARGADVNAKNKGGDTPLKLAATRGQMEVVELLIAKGADINAKDNNGDTTLANAVMYDKKEMAELLIAKGADVNAKSNIGNAPLHTAAASNRMEVAELLIAKGADINAKDNYGNTPLHQAAGFDRVEVAELLIAKGADINAKNNYGNTPLQWAERNNHKDVADLLRNHGAG